MERSNSSKHDRYIVKSLVHAWKVLGAFATNADALRLRDIVVRTGLKPEMCFRLLRTLIECGAVEKLEATKYHRLVSIPPRRRYRIGYADASRSCSFSNQVFEGLRQACQDQDLELIMVDNRRDPGLAIRNADRLIREGINLAVEFQIVEVAATAPTIASKFQCAGIPLIGIDTAHPGAIYYGANNYEAGLMGGRYLGHYANEHWGGIADEILLIGTSWNGCLAQMRMEGILAGINQVLPNSTNRQIFSIETETTFKASLRQVRNHLRNCTARRIMIGALNDAQALGALRAFQEVGREANCVVVGQGAEPEARAEMRQPDTRLIGSVAYFPETYGKGIVRLALDILSGNPVRQATFTKHRLITPENVDRVYPNDPLLAIRAPEYP